MNDNFTVDDTSDPLASPEQTQPPTDTLPDPEPEASSVPDVTEGDLVADEAEGVNSGTVKLQIVGGADRFSYYHGDEAAPRFVTKEPTDVPVEDVETILASAAANGVSILNHDDDWNEAE